MSLYFVILVSASAAILTYVTLGLATHSFVFDIRDVGAGLSGGFLNLLGTILLLKALAMGSMEVVSGVGRSYVLILIDAERSDKQRRPGLPPVPSAACVSEERLTAPTRGDLRPPRRNGP